MQVRAFIGGLRSVCVNSLLKPNSNANCEDDGGNELLSNCGKLLFPVEATSSVTTEVDRPAPVDHLDALIEEVVRSSRNVHAVSTEPKLDDVEEDVLLYVGGASLRSSSSCIDCSNLVRRPASEKLGVFLQLKEYQFVKKGLLSMTEPAAKAISEMELCFRKCIERIYTGENVLAHLLDEVKAVRFPACPIHEETFNLRHKGLFMRLRLHAWAKLRMRAFHAEKETKAAAKKLKKLSA